MVLSLTGTQARPRREPPGGAIVPRWCLAGAPCVDGASAAEGAPNSRVWTQLALIEIQPGPAQIGGSLRGCHRPPTTLCYLRLSVTTPMGLLSVAPRWLGDQGRERPPSTSYRRLYSRSTTYLIAAL